MKKSFFILFLVFILSFSLSWAGSQQTSSTAASTIITNVRTYLNEEDEGFWDDDYLLVWLNDGLLDITSRTRCMETTEDITLQTDTLEYSLSTDYIGVETAIYHGSETNQSGTTDYYKRGLRRIRAVDAGHETGDEPLRFYLWDDKIGIDPLPVSGVSGDLVSIYLYERPSGVTTGQNIPIPAVYDKALTCYIVVQALLRDRRVAEAEKFQLKYMEELDRYRADFIDRPKEPVETVK